MTYPKLIYGTWRWNGNWLCCDRVVATDVDITPIMPESEDILCPCCEYPEAVQLGMRQGIYQMLFYCPECGTVWATYPARCLRCDKFVECGDDNTVVVCPFCNAEWDIELIKDEHEDPDFHAIYIEDGD